MLIPLTVINKSEINYSLVFNIIISTRPASGMKYETLHLTVVSNYLSPRISNSHAYDVPDKTV